MKNITSSLLLSTILAFVIASPAMAASKHVNALGGKIRPLIATDALGQKIKPLNSAKSNSMGSNSVGAGPNVGWLGQYELAGTAGTLQFEHANGKTTNATYTVTDTYPYKGNIHSEDIVTDIVFKSGKTIQENDIQKLDRNGDWTSNTTIVVTKNGVSRTEDIVVRQNNETGKVSESTTIGNKTYVDQGYFKKIYDGNSNDVEDDFKLTNAKGKKEDLDIGATIYTNDSGGISSVDFTTTGKNFAGKSVDTQVIDTVTSN